MQPRDSSEPRPPVRSGLTEDILEAAYDAIFTFDLPGQVITAWNRGAEQLYGWPAADALGRTPAELLHSEFDVPRTQVIEDLLRDGHWSGTVGQTARDGARVVVDARWVVLRGAGGEPDRVLEINRDVTEHRLAEERIRLIVDQVRDYAIFLLDARGRVTTWSRGAETITGWSATEATGRTLEIVSEGGGSWSEHGLAIADEAGQWTYEGWLRRNDGSTFWANSVITALRGPAALLLGYAAIIRDDTERRELAAARENFVNFAAHEMRAPVTLLHGYLSMLRTGDIGVAAFTAALPTIVARTEELQMLIEQMIESSRLQQGRLELRPEVVDLRPVVEELVSLTRTLAGDRHDIVLEVEGDDFEVVVDRPRTRSIVRNLLDNAVKYSPAGGPVACRLTAAGGVVEVSVTDRGIGIRAADLPVVFSPYGRVHSPATRGIAGAGLGLFVSRELARMQNGELGVESRPGRGSTFTLTLPAAGRPGAVRPAFG